MFSVWNQGRRGFDYYETPGAGPTHAPAASHVSMRGLGATPDEAAWPLPPGAKKVGFGAVARGKIASLGSIPAGARTVVIVGGLLAAAWLGRRYLR